MRIANNACPLLALALAGPLTVAISSTSTDGSEISRTAAAAFAEVPQRNTSKATSIPQRVCSPNPPGPCCPARHAVGDGCNPSVTLLPSSWYLRSTRTDFAFRHSSRSLPLKDSIEPFSRDTGVDKVKQNTLLVRQSSNTCDVNAVP